MSTFLSCDNLVSNLCTIGDYVIEWRLNSSSGTVVFVTGNTGNPDTDIQAFHPFTDEVVFAGTLYPVIRYAYINGVKYTSDYEEGSIFSPDFINCLDPVVVEAVDCSTVLGTDVNYPYYLTYNNVTDTGSDKSRLIKYDIASDTKYLAWDFLAYTVAEQLEIYYCTALDSVGTLVDNFIMGTRNSSGGTLTTDLYPVNYPTNPRIYNYYATLSTKFITDISSFSYTAGDYLKIKITGSVLEPSVTNTNWAIKLKCLTVDDIDSSFYDTSISKITDTPAIAYTGTPTCRYSITYNTSVAPGAQNKVTSPYFIYKYMHVNHASSYSSQLLNPITSNHNWKYSSNGAWMWYGAGVNTCTNLASGDTISVSKNTTDITFTFTNSADYNVFVSNINSIQASADYATWLTSTSSDLIYYSFYYIQYIVASSCGDSQTNIPLYVHLGSTIDYDAVAKTIKFTFNIPTNDIIAEDCNDSYSIAATYISYMNNTKSLTISPANSITYIRRVDPISAQKPAVTLQNIITTSQATWFYIHDVLLNGIVDLSSTFCLDSASHEWRLYRNYDRTTFNSYATHEERLNCYQLERKVFLRTDDCADYDAGTWETVYTAPCITSTTTSTSTSTTTAIPTTTTTTTSA